MSNPSYTLAFVMVVFLASLSVSCGKSRVHAAGEPTDASSPTDQQIISLDDKTFLINAEKGLIRQRTMAAEALDKTQDPQVREFAHQVVVDRGRELDQLMSLMSARNIVQAPALAEGIQLEVSERLHGLSGDAFDREFLSLMAADQQQTVGNFRSAAETSPDPEIRNYASSVLPSLRKDFEAAAGLERKFHQQ